MDLSLNNCATFNRWHSTDKYTNSSSLHVDKTSILRRTLLCMFHIHHSEMLAKIRGNDTVPSFAIYRNSFSKQSLIVILLPTTVLSWPTTDLFATHHDTIVDKVSFAKPCNTVIFFSTHSVRHSEISSVRSEAFRLLMHPRRLGKAPNSNVLLPQLSNVHWALPHQRITNTQDIEEFHHLTTINIRRIDSSRLHHQVI